MFNKEDTAMFNKTGNVRPCGLALGTLLALLATDQAARAATVSVTVRRGEAAIGKFTGDVPRPGLVQWNVRGRTWLEIECIRVGAIQCGRAGCPQGPGERYKIITRTPPGSGIRPGDEMTIGIFMDDPVCRCKKAGRYTELYCCPGNVCYAIGPAFGNRRHVIDVVLEYDGDCNDNGILDEEDIAGGYAEDCNSNGIPDECELDCDGNGVPDECDILAGAPDCDGDGLLDSCAFEFGLDDDCNENGTPDLCDIAAGTSTDDDSNGIPDECDGFVLGDLDGDGDTDVDDFYVFAGTFGACDSDPEFIAAADYDRDGCITLDDYQTWLACYRGS